ncbi:cell division protein ZapE [Candidatus Fukatsuia anoeciicola]|uniref:cell division protein ZapE n=1 Tax=Candidatus Fukatsuia anoeciicola TaxID=2994492 RepID=UPI00346426E4
MQSNILISLYQNALNIDGFYSDDSQYMAITRLEALYQQIIHRQNIPQTPNTLYRCLTYLLGKKKSALLNQPIQGLYIWGGVGRGKTWLMDLFFYNLPGKRKLRLHFHYFMLQIHQQLTKFQGNENPLEKVADEFKVQTDVLCFDEFFVSNITDAMLLTTLLAAFFARGITLVITSNIPPDNLYCNGLQRDRFLPAIVLIKKYCEIMNVDAGIDYRLRSLTSMPLYLTPLNHQTEQKMTQFFIKLAGTKEKSSSMLQVNHRSMHIICRAEGILAINFHVLCKEARSFLDYIVLSQQYHTVLLHNVPCMKVVETLVHNEENHARRFLELIDEFYEHKVKLIIAAQVPMHKLYQGKHLKLEYQRCLSRLQEMQSEKYLRLPHIP